MSNDLLRQFIFTLPFLLISLIVHELAHGWVAWLLGDPTAKQLRHAVLDPTPPSRHVEHAMLFLTFLGSNGSFFFGWAKPVPIGPWHFKHPQRGMMLVGAAGPLANIAMACPVPLGLAWLLYPSAPLWVLEAINLTFALNIIHLGRLQPHPDPAAGRVAHRRRVAAGRGVQGMVGARPLRELRDAAGPRRGGRRARRLDSTIGAVLRAASGLLPWA